MRRVLMVLALVALLAISFAPAAAQDDDMARIRVAHLSPDTPAVDVYINGDLSDVQGLAFPSVTGWVSVPAGTYSIAVSPAGTSLDDAAIGPADLTFEAGSWTTVAAVGSLQAGTLAPAVLEEDFSPTNGRARISLFHAIPGVGPVDVFANDALVINYLSFPGSFTRPDGTLNDGFWIADVPSATYDLEIRATGTDTVLLEAPGRGLAADTNYFIAAAIGSGGPFLVVQATSVGEDMAADVPEPAPDPTQSIAEIAVSNPFLSTLVAAVTEAGLVDVLGDSDAGPFTVFAPTDGAFRATLTALGLSAEDVLGDIDLLTTILTYHVVEGTLTSDDLVGLDSVTTLQGEDISLSMSGLGVLQLNNSVEVTQADVLATNGVVHVIRRVLIPPSVIAAISGAAVDEDTSGELPTIAEIAAGDNNFSTLVAAVTAAGLADTLADPDAGPFTVFAPTNDAFVAALSALGLSAQDVLGNMDLLTDILTYHVVAGAVPAETVVTLDSATTLQGSDITIEVVDGVVVLNGTVNVVATDIMASNGIIHVIDFVLVPPME